MPHVLANTCPCARAKDEIVFVHGSTVLPQPSFGLEFVSIGTIDSLMAPYNSGVHADTVTSRNVRP